jgi:hypothetical protein
MVEKIQNKKVRCEEVRKRMTILRHEVQSRKKVKRLAWISAFITQYQEYDSLYGRNLVRNTYNSCTSNAETADKLEDFFKSYKY